MPPTGSGVCCDRRRRWLRLLLTALVGLGLPAAGSAEIYEWVDDEGDLHFSAQPPPRDQGAKVRKRSESNSAEEAETSTTLDAIPDDGFVPFTRALAWTRKWEPLRMDLAPLHSRMKPRQGVGWKRSGEDCAESSSIQTSALGDAGMPPTIYVFQMGTLARRRFAALGFGEQVSGARADFVLKPYMLDLEIDSCQLPDEPDAVGRARMKLRFQLHRENWDRSLVWEKTVVGEFKGRTEAGGLAVDRIVANAYLDAVDQVFGEQTLVDLLDPRTSNVLVGEAAPVADPVARGFAVRYGDGSTRFDYERAKRSTATVRVADGHGSGFAIADGLILTNEHVVRGRSQVMLLFEERHIPARVIYRNAPRDIALLQLDESGGVEPLPIARAEPSPGEPVFVVGTPLDEELQYTLTRGIVSAHRRFKGKRFYQTDAAINPGSSGSPAFNERGEVIGVAVAGTLSAGGGSMNINYLIPIEDALVLLGVPSPKDRPFPAGRELD